MSGQQVVANCKTAWVLLKQVIRRNKVAKRLRHLGSVGVDQTVVHPVIGILEICSSRLREFVFVMRKTQVETSAVNVEVVTEGLGCHSAALDVPAWSA